MRKLHFINGCCHYNQSLSLFYILHDELDLIDRVPEELWTEVCDIVQEAAIKTVAKKKKCKNSKRLSDSAL